MEAPPASLYQWLNFCSTSSWKSILRNAYYNDNRFFLDDIAHTCMLQDITKLHVKSGLSPPVFVKMFAVPSNIQDMNSAQAIILAQLTGANATVSVLPTDSPVPVTVSSQDSDVTHDSGGNYFCYECGRVSQTTKAWHNHRRLSHGVVPVSKYLVDGHVCKVCLKRFPSVSRMYQHPEQDSRKCPAAW